MPVLEPPIRPDEIRVEPLDVVAHRERGHLSHLGFARAPAEASRDDEVEVVDARPVRRNHDKLAVHLVGRMRLSRSERVLMTTWLERRQRARTLAGDYLMCDDVQRDVVTGRAIGRRMSSAMLVHGCVQACTGVELVALDSLPASTGERLMDIWGERSVQVAGYRGELEGDGPWPVLLPAHVVHALAREDESVRAQPLHAMDDDWDA